MEMDEKIANASDVAFTVRSYEAGISNHVTLPTLCNYMQEAAGISAARLGWGIQALQAEGLTWMLSRLRVSVTRYVPWGETVTVRTWPSGTKGRLIAKRCFLGLDEKGEALFRASSEWLYVDMNAQKIAKLPETFGELVPPGTPDFELPDIGGKFAHLPSVNGSADVLTRSSDLDFNDHVNNVHYVEWMLEGGGHGGDDGHAGRVTLPGELDIVFRQAAKAGESLVSEFCAAGEKTLHAIRRRSDDAILATAAMQNGRAVAPRPPETVGSRVSRDREDVA
jgi:acyl-ACP thioesterase